jgi:hypothetical protein
MGVEAMIKADVTQDIPKQTALLKVGSFVVPKKMFVSDEKMKFGFKSAIGSTTMKAELKEKELNMSWVSELKSPQFIVESKTKIAQEMLSNILNAIPVINIDGTATGSFKNLNMAISSNLGDEIGAGLKREIGNKVSEAQGKIQGLIDEKINKPKNELMSALGSNQSNLNSLNGVADLYKKNEGRIKAEIEKLKKGGTKGLEEQGKKLLKGFKF